MIVEKNIYFPYKWQVKNLAITSAFSKLIKKNQRQNFYVSYLKLYFSFLLKIGFRISPVLQA